MLKIKIQNINQLTLSFTLGSDRVWVEGVSEPLRRTWFLQTVYIGIVWVFLMKKTESFFYISCSSLCLSWQHSWKYCIKTQRFSVIIDLVTNTILLELLPLSYIYITVQYKYNYRTIKLVLEKWRGKGWWTTLKETLSQSPFSSLAVPDTWAPTKREK